MSVSEISVTTSTQVNGNIGRLRIHLLKKGSAALSVIR